MKHLFDQIQEVFAGSDVPQHIQEQIYAVIKDNVVEMANSVMFSKQELQSYLNAKVDKFSVMKMRTAKESFAIAMANNDLVLQKEVFVSDAEGFPGAEKYEFRAWVIKPHKGDA